MRVEDKNGEPDEDGDDEYELPPVPLPNYEWEVERLYPKDWFTGSSDDFVEVRPAQHTPPRRN